MHKITCYVPEAQLEIVKQAMFDAGAGRINNYEHCCWQTNGQGQFKPLAGSNPTIGTQDNLETVEEYLVEMVCEDHLLQAVITAMKAAHPYEEPAYSAWAIHL